MDRYVVGSSLFFRLYAGAWRLARPLLRRNRRLADGWTERLVPGADLQNASSCPWAGPADVWIQAASGGEAHLAVALLREIEMPVGMERLRVLLTTWTRQGRDVLESALAALHMEKPWLSAEVRFAPLDDPATARRAVEMVHPRLLILLETELWPGLLAACAETGVPVHVFNARMTKASFEWYKILRPVLRRLPVCRVHAITGEDAARFARVFDLVMFGSEQGSKQVEAQGLTHGADPAAQRVESENNCRRADVMPNIKFARAAEAVAQPVNQDFVPLFQGRSAASPVFLLASVRKQEEKRLAPLLHRLLLAYPRASVVVVPRHLHRVQTWMERLYDLGLSPLAATALLERIAEERPLPSRTPTASADVSAAVSGTPSASSAALAPLVCPSGEPARGESCPSAAGSDTTGAELSKQTRLPEVDLADRVLVWDRFGDLPRLYGVADAAFVGGSFGLGGQNFLEALAAGVVPCVGPSLENFRWALGNEHPPSLTGAGLLRVCPSSRKLAAALAECAAESLAADPAATKESVRRRFREWVAPRTGGSALAARLIAEALTEAGRR